MSFSDLLKPRPEVLSDDGLEGIIDLAKVNSGSKRRVPLESRPADFFALTYPSADVRRVIEKLGARFAGERDMPGLFLFEGLKGSGKSHLLLLAYHLFASPKAAQAWLAQHNLSCALPEDAVVILNKFTDLPLTSIWDFIFEQLTGKRPAQTVVQPSLDEVQAVLGDRRLVLIFDELEQGINVIGDPALKNQNIAFLQMLSEWSNRSDQVTLFTSIYSDHEEPGSTLKRVPAVRVQFSHANDRARVVLHRLFSNYLEADPNFSAMIVDSYLANWRRYSNVDVEKLRTEMIQAFPFSPDLLEVLLQRVPARGGFQNLRGALGFLAHLVRLHYKTADLLTPAHALVNDRAISALLADLDTGGDLINRAKGNCNDLKTKLPLAEDVASAVLLYTLTGTGRTVGATREELLRCVLRPGVDINTFEQTLLAFQKYASHFHIQEGRHFFDPQENADAKVEFRSLLLDDFEARQTLRDLWVREVFRYDNVVVFTEAEETKEACEQKEKNGLRYVLAPRRLKAEERHRLYHGLSLRNQVILLEPREATFNLDVNTDLLKWAKRHLAAQGLAVSAPDAERRSQYERISREDKKNVVDAIRRAGLIYLRFDKFGATSADDLVEEESLGNASDKDGVLTSLSQSLFPVQLIEEHLGSRLAEIKGRTVGEIDREYRNTLGFPVPTHTPSVSNALRSMCKGPNAIIGIFHSPRGNFCNENPPLSDTEFFTAEIGDPFSSTIAPVEPAPHPTMPTPFISSLNGTSPSPTPVLDFPSIPLPSIRREAVAIPPQVSAGVLRQELAGRLQGNTDAKITRVAFTVFLSPTDSDLSIYPASLRGALSGAGTLSAEIVITKEGEFTKGQLEQMTESLPQLNGAEYSARLDVLIELPQAAGAAHGQLVS